MEHLNNRATTAFLEIIVLMALNHFTYSFNFDTFTFFTSENFENVTTDYFEIVFKPANDYEWEVFYNQKT